MMKLLFGAHVAGGSVALLSMLIPLISRKGGLLHVRAGWVFVAGMTIVSITALMLSVLRFLTQPTADGRVGGVLLFYIAILTGAGVSAGIRVLRAKKRTSAHRNPWDVGVATLLTAGGILVAAYGVAISHALLISFAIIGMINGGGQLAYWLRPPRAPMHWWYEHMNQMLGACIAATTAFVVNNAGRLGLPDTSLLVWLGPATIGVPATIIWTRYYRRRFAGTRPRVGHAVRATAGAAALLVVATLAQLQAYAQALAPGTDADAFAVASVKPSMSGPQVPLPRIFPDGQLRIIGVTLRDLIRLAYPSPSGQVRVDGGPSWITASRFDVIAKTDGSRPTAAMVRRLLQERFALQARTATRDGTVFALVQARRNGQLGPSITEAPCPPASATPAVFNQSLEESMRGSESPATECSAFRIGAGPTFLAESITMARFAAILSEFPMLGNSPVIDRTGLTGTYSFELRARADNNPNPEAGPLMPVALEEQLGLKLERGTGPIDTVIVEHASPADGN